MGRNHKAITYASHYFSGHAGPIIAWVVGLGGKQSPGTEHLEIALSLKRHGVRRYRVHAVEPSKPLLDSAKHVLEHPEGVPAVFTARDSNSEAFNRRDLNEQREYIYGLTGVKPLAGVPFRFRVPVDVVRRFQWHGPGVSGDILHSIPSESPDLITCINVAQHYDAHGQRRMAASLAESLKPAGLILTNQRADLNSAFIRELESRLSPGVVLEEIPLAGNHFEKLLAFHHGRRSSAGGVILLR